MYSLKFVENKETGEVWIATNDRPIMYMNKQGLHIQKDMICFSDIPPLPKKEEDDDDPEMIMGVND